MAGVWVRRGVAAAGGVASFGACYGGLTVAYPKMDAAVALGWSALPLTVVLGVLLGWAERPRSGEGSESSRSDEDNEGRQAMRVTRSPHAQAVGTVEGLNIGPGAVFNSPVFHVGDVGETARPIADDGAGAPDEPGLSGPVRAGDTLPLRNPTFTGRTAELAELERRLADGPVAVVAVRGLGGIGKSQLALEYAYRMRQAGRYRLAAWVRADTPVTVIEDLAALAGELGVASGGTVGEIAVEVAGALRARQDWLLVFDNAQAPGDLAGMLPGGGHVVITSRNRVWSGIGTQLDLAEFTRAESVRFLCERSGCDEPEAAGELAADLGDLPLALAQAAAYIDAQSMTIRRYLELYRDPALARTLRDAGLDSTEYPASVARTWLLSFRALSAEHPPAVELLRLCAYLDPDDIDLDLLAEGRQAAGTILAKVLGNQLEITEAAGALARVSLATAASPGHLRVHRLVQAVTRDQLDSDQAAWAQRALNLVSAIFPSGPYDHRSWPACASVAPHVLASVRHIDSYLALARQAGSLLTCLGIYLTTSAQLTAARTTQERALAIKEAAYGPNHPEIAITLGNLGIVQQQLGAQ